MDTSRENQNDPFEGYPLKEKIERRIFLMRTRIKNLRDYCLIDDSVDHLLQTASKKCDSLENRLKETPSNITEQTYNNLVSLHEEVVAIGLVIHQDAPYEEKIKYLLLLCDTLEKSPKGQLNSDTTLALAQFIYNNTRNVFEDELSRIRGIQDSDLDQDATTLFSMTHTLSRKILSDPIQLTHLSKLLILTIEASTNQSSDAINHLKQEIKNHKLSMSERLYAATFHKLHKAFYEYLNRLAVKAFNKGYFNRSPLHFRVNKQNKPTFTHKSGVQLFKKPKLHKQINKVAEHIDKKRKAGSKK